MGVQPQFVQGAAARLIRREIQQRATDAAALARRIDGDVIEQQVVVRR